MYIVERFHDKDSAIKAKEHFEKIHSKKEIPDDIPVVKVKDLNIQDKEIELFEPIYLLNLAPSKAEAKRLIKQGGVKVDGEKVEDFLYKVDLTKEHIIQAGKRKFVKLQV